MRNSKVISVLVFLSFGMLMSISLKVYAMEGANFKYSGIFDENIYDISPIKISSRPLARQEINDPVEILQIRKLRQLESKYLVLLKSLADTYDAVLSEDERDAIGDIIDSGRRNIFSAPFTLFYNACSFVERVFLRKEKKEERWGEKRLKEGKKIDNPHIEHDLFTLKVELENRKKGIQFEAIKPLEEDYVRQKREIPVCLQKQIQRSLLLFRESEGFSSEIERRFVRDALALPRAPKRLIRTTIPEKETDLRELMTRVGEAFSTFSPDIREEFLTIAYEMAINSITPQDTEESLRTVCFFYGPPGGGKTTSVQKFAKIMRVPCVRILINSKEDLAKKRIEGVDRFTSLRESNGVGWLLRPLFIPIMEEDPSKTYQNAILLIDDIDMGIAVDEALSILKQYMDAVTRDLESPYFGCPIDIRYLNIFVTSNNPIPLDPKYDALRSRVRPPKEFPSSSIQENSDPLRKFLRDVMTMHDLPLDDFEEISSLVIRHARTSLERDQQTPDFRNIRRAIRDSVIKVKLDALRSNTPVDIRQVLGRE